MEGDIRYEIEAHGHAGHYVPYEGDTSCTVAGARLTNGVLSARFDERSRRYSAGHRRNPGSSARRTGRRWQFERAPAFAWGGAEGAGAHLAAPMPGRIVLVRAAPATPWKKARSCWSWKP